MNIDKVVELFKEIRAKYPSQDITNQDILKIMELKIMFDSR